MTFVFPIAFFLNCVIGCEVDDKDASSRAQVLLKKSENGKLQIWSEEDKLTACFVGKATEVAVKIGGARHPLERIGETDVWTWSTELPNLERGILTYSFDVVPPSSRITTARNWRGPKAPPPFETTKMLKGEIRKQSIRSKNLGSERALTVYLPPGYRSLGNYPVIYAADGESIADYAAVIEPLFTSGEVPPLVIVGVHSGEYVGGQPKDLSLYDVSKDLRAVEYLPIMGDQRFQSHALFFTKEVLEWAEKELGVSGKREMRAVFGVSNGGRFAATMGVEHPNIFGTIIAFSLGSGVAPELPTHPKVVSKFYFASGIWETGFHKNTEAFHVALQKMMVPTQFKSRVSGHDSIMWQEEFAAAVMDGFGKK